MGITQLIASCVASDSHDPLYELGLFPIFERAERVYFLAWGIFSEQLRVIRLKMSLDDGMSISLELVNVKSISYKILPRHMLQYL